MIFPKPGLHWSLSPQPTRTVAPIFVLKFFLIYFINKAVFYSGHGGLIFVHEHSIGVESIATFGV